MSTRRRRLFTPRLMLQMLAASFLVIMSLVGLGLCAMSGALNGLVTDAAPRRPDRFDACIMARKFVERDLLSPASAQYQPCEDADITDAGEDHWIVKAYVDSDNAFGASIRTFYRAELVYRGDDQWHLEFLTY